MKHLNIEVYGRVQGVLFRVTAKEKADELGITGFARNESYGTVYIEVEGDRDNLEKFLNWCHEGPESANVDKVEITEGPLKNFSKFDRDFADY